MRRANSTQIITVIALITFGFMFIIQPLLIWKRSVFHNKNNDFLSFENLVTTNNDEDRYDVKDFVEDFDESNNEEERDDDFNETDRIPRQVILGKRSNNRKIIDDKITVVITTYKQPVCLERMILLMRSCPIVAEIRVNWFEEKEPSIFSEHNKNHRVPVIFDKYPDKISHRFHPRDFRTDAVFSVDVDMFYSCESLAKTFDTWRQNENSVVGYHGRFLRKKGKYSFAASYVSPHFRYNTVFVTKGGITHRKMFDEFFKDEYKHLRNLVDEYMTAEDLLMSFILSKIKVKPIMVCPEVKSICHVQCIQNETKPLVVRTAHKRLEMLNTFFDDFGRPNVFRKTSDGSENVVWQAGKPQEVCLSWNKSEFGNTPHCERFCAFSLICPSAVL